MKKWWNDYWFRPWPLVDLAMVRIIVVATQIALLLFAPNINLEAHRAFSGLPDELYQPLPLLQAITLGAGYRPPFEVLEILWYASLASGVLALVGFRTNVSVAIFAVCCTLMQAHTFSYGSIHHSQSIMMITLGMLALSPSGRALSLDSKLRRADGISLRSAGPWYRAHSSYARWPILTVQWFFVMMYFSAVYSKAINSDFGWANGYTLQYFLIMDGLRWDRPLSLWLAQFHTLVLLSQWAVLAFQATFALAVLFPRMKWIYVPAGLAFHIGILVTLSAPFYQWIALYAVFIPWSDAFALLARRRARGLALGPGDLPSRSP